MHFILPASNRPNRCKKAMKSRQSHVSISSLRNVQNRVLWYPLSEISEQTAVPGRRLCVLLGNFFVGLICLRIQIANYWIKGRPFYVSFRGVIFCSVWNGTIGNHSSENHCFKYGNLKYRFDFTVRWENFILHLQFIRGVRRRSDYHLVEF